MDGIHDLGGREGFGSVDVSDGDAQFHEPWEARVHAMVNTMSRAGDWNLDWFRHCRELIMPIDYLTRPYFDQWIQTYSAMLVNSRLATIEELASGRARSKRRQDATPPLRPDEVEKAQASSKRFDREIDRPARYAIGAVVRCVAHGHRQHTRLPAYVRGRCGLVHAHHGAHVFPDANARGEKYHEHLYTISLQARDLWGAQASACKTTGADDRVLVNLWESYLVDA